MQGNEGARVDSLGFIRVDEMTLGNGNILTVGGNN